MNWSEWGKKLLPHAIIIVIFAVVSLFFMAPVWQQGKVLPQNDIKQWAGSHQEIKEFEDKTGERTLWTNSMFGGMPTYQISPYSPNSLIGLRFVYNLFVSSDMTVFPIPVSTFFLYMVAAYLMLLAFRVNPWVAMMGGIAYALSSFNIIIIEAGHMSQANALATAPLVIGALVYTIRSRKYLLGGALFGVALAFHLRTNHPQISYYTILVIGLYLLGELIYHIRQGALMSLLKAGAVLAVAAVLAVGTNISSLMVTAEYSKETIRGKSELTQDPKIASSGLDRDYAFQWSNGIGEVFTVLIPDFRGGASGAIGQNHKSAADNAPDQMKELVMSADQYWGDQPFTSGPAYFGAVICFLFVLGLFLLKGTEKWWILAAAILSIVLSWGHNFPAFNNFMFDHFPLYNKFRSPAFTLTMGSIVFPILAAIVVDRILRQVKWDKPTIKKFYYAAAVTGGLCLIFTLVPSLAGDFTKPDNGDVNYFKELLQRSGYPQEQINQLVNSAQWANIQDAIIDARISILRSDAMRSLIFILLAGGLIFLYIRGILKKPFVLAGLALLVLIDMGAVDKRFLNDKSFVSKRSNAFIPTEADQAIMQDKDPDYRVLNLTVNVFNDATTSYFHKSIGGYHGAKLRHFQDMRERYLDEAVMLMQQNMGKVPPQELLRYMQMQRKLTQLNMMNMKYIIAGPSPSDVIQNPYALGHAWFVRGVQWAPTADAEIAAIGNLNAKDTVVVREKLKDYLQGFNPTADSSGSINMAEYKPNHLTYTSNAPTEKLAVFSEIYYDNKLGWNAYIDGKKVQHIRVDWLLRGLRVPAGQHKIEFKFEPETFAKGERYTLIASILLILFVIGGIVYAYFKERDTQPMPLETVID